MNKNSRRKILIWTVLGLLAVLVLNSAFRTPPAEASLWGDFYNKFVSPLFGNPATTSSSPSNQNLSSPPPLYKPAVDYEQAVVAAVKKASPAVVAVTISKYVPVIEQCPYNPFSNLPPEFQQFFGGQYPQFYQPCEKGSQLKEVGGGSGFVISADGLVLTNKHVVSDTQASYTVFTNDGKKYPAKVLARDPVQDLAVLKIGASGLPTVELGDSDSLELGQTAIAIGNALGEFRNTVSVGVVSGLSRTVTASGPGVGEETIQGVIQTDAAINPGNSGGPLLNLRGQVVGINTAIAEGAQNIGFTIPINRAKRDIQSVIRSGEIQAPFLGVRYITITPEIAKTRRLPVENGALVRGNDQGPAVQPGSPAAQAGLAAEDIILEVNGQKIDPDHVLGDIVSGFNVGDTITLRINRGGNELELRATLAKRPQR